jgi:MATE family multidrug resistance protein
MSHTSPFKRESRALLHLAGPIILSQIAQVLTGLVDTVMSGQAGAVQQAVVALGVALWIPVFVSLMSVVQALSPVIAHHFGAGDREAVAQDAREGIWLAVWFSAVPLLLLPFGPRLLVAAGIAPELAARTGVFLWGIGLGIPAALVYRALAFYSASINQTRPIMVLAFIGLGVNAFFNWVLINGHFGLPAMGGAGCGWASGIGMWVALLLLAAHTARAPVYQAYYVWRHWRLPRWDAQRRLLRIGLPMGGAALAEVAAFSSIAILVGRFGDVQIAAHQIALNFSALIFMLPMGLSAALSIRVGHALGARDPRQARTIAWTGIRLGLLIAACAIGPIIALRHEVAAVYSSDAAVRALAANLLLFAAFWQLFDATQVCSMGALRGYKVTLLPMLLMTVAFWCIGIPSGTWLAYHGWRAGHPMEVYGFWVGLVVGLVLVSIGLVISLRIVADRAVRRAAPVAMDDVAAADAIADAPQP